MSVKLLIKSLLRRKLVVILLFAQLAVTLALIVNSSLLALQARELLQRDTGLDLHNTLVVKLKPTSKRLGEEPALTDLLERQLAGVRQISGVIAAAYSNQAPLRDYGSNGDAYDLDDEEHTKANPVAISVASAGIFDVLGVKLIQGELPIFLEPLMNFDDSDLFKNFDIKTRNVVITESLAKHLFGDKTAVGRYTNNGRVAAVVSDFTGQRYSEKMSYNLLIVDHMYPGAIPYVIMVRTQPGQVTAVQKVIANKLRAIDSNIHIMDIKTLEQKKNELYGRERGLSFLLITLSLLMLLVAMVSAYSNAFFHVLKQQQEIGIKRALGANRGQIVSELFADVWLTTILGCALGIFVSLGLNHLLGSVLTIPAMPAWLLMATIGLLVVCVTVASWYPAKIATTVSPIVATKSL